MTEIVTPNPKDYAHITGVPISVMGRTVQRCALCGLLFVDSDKPPADRLSPAITLAAGVAFDGVVVVWDGNHWGRAAPDPQSGRYPPPGCGVLV